MATQRSGETYRELVAEPQSVLNKHSSSTLGPCNERAGVILHAAPTWR